MSVDDQDIPSAFLDREGRNVRDALAVGLKEDLDRALAERDRLREALKLIAAEPPLGTGVIHTADCRCAMCVAREALR